MGQPIWFFQMAAHIQTMSAVNEVIDRTMRDEEFLDQFRANPEEALEEYNLTQEEKEALMSQVNGEVKEEVEERRADTVYTV